MIGGGGVAVALAGDHLGDEGEGRRPSGSSSMAASRPVSRSASRTCHGATASSWPGAWRAGCPCGRGAAGLRRGPGSACPIAVEHLQPPDLVGELRPGAEAGLPGVAGSPARPGPGPRPAARSSGTGRPAARRSLTPPGSRRGRRRRPWRRAAWLRRRPGSITASTLASTPAARGSWLADLLDGGQHGGRVGPRRVPVEAPAPACRRPSSHCSLPDEVGDGGQPGAHQQPGVDGAVVRPSRTRAGAQSPRTRRASVSTASLELPACVAAPGRRRPRGGPRTSRRLVAARAVAARPRAATAASASSRSGGSPSRPSRCHRSAQLASRTHRCRSGSSRQHRNQNRSRSPGASVSADGAGPGGQHVQVVLGRRGRLPRGEEPFRRPALLPPRLVAGLDQRGEPFRVRGLPVGELQQLRVPSGGVEHAARQPPRRYRGRPRAVRRR